MKNLHLGTALVLSIVVAPVGPARAQGTPEERSACIGDAFRFCSPDIPNVAQIEACLIRNRSGLDPACQAEFVSSQKTKLHPSHFERRQ
jgi:hypothetical protein